MPRHPLARAGGRALALGPLAPPSLAPAQSLTASSSLLRGGLCVGERGSPPEDGSGSRSEARRRKPTVCPQSPSQMWKAASQSHHPHFLFDFFY
jgi:hypothetical protein